MKPRVWIPAVLVLLIALSAVLALGASPASPRGGRAAKVLNAHGASPASLGLGGSSAKASIPGASAVDPFAAKRKPAPRAGAKPASKMADPAERERVAREIAAGWREFHERRARGGAVPARTAARRAFDALSAKCGADLDAHWDLETGLPIFLMGTGEASAPERDPRTSAARFLDENRALFEIDDPASEFVFTRAETEASGASHLRYQQRYCGLEVWANDIVVHVGPEGRVAGVNGRYAATPRLPGGVEPSLGAEQAAAAAAAAFDRAALPPAEAPRLVIAPDRDGALRLAWIVRAEIALDSRWDVFVDAATGAVFRKLSLVATDGPVQGTGTDLSNQSRALGLYQIGQTYYMIDASKTMWNQGQSTPPQTLAGGIRMLDARHGDQQNLWFITAGTANGWTAQQKNCVSASFFIGKIYDYYEARHARNSINGAGGTIEAIVNYGSNYNNAFWNGTFMAYGNGDNQTFSDLAGALDVAGHEMTHGVVENTANLVYEFQPGALNESVADVFGACIEDYAFGAGGGSWWLLAEDVTTPAIPGDCLRNMQNPAQSLNAQPTKMSEYQNLNANQDHGGVHINSGIPNRAAYLIGNALGLAKLDRIYYKALSQYMTRSSQFIDARLAVIQAAKDLYGNTSAEAAACATAFDTVEIFDGTGGTPPDDEPPVEGSEWIAVKQPIDSHLYRVSAAFTGAVEIANLPVFNKPAFTDNGQTMMFVDGNHDLWLAGSDGSGADRITEDGGWWSVAVSPDGSRIALTTDFPDSSIYVLDLAAEQVTRHYLRCVTHDGTDPTYPDFADQIDFSLDGEYVLFDAYYSAGLSGSDIESWDINLLRLSDGVAFRVFPTQPSGALLGNPVFASNSDLRIALDYVAPDGEVTVYGANLETGDLGVITHNQFSPGRPSFSTDDRAVVYHFANQQGGAWIWTVSLEADGITGIPATDTQRLPGGYDPVWFAVGQRTEVALAYFEARVVPGACEVSWGAFSERNHAGYNLYRYEGEAPKLIAQGLHEPVSRGAVTAYRYLDRAAGGAPAKYLLEAVDRSGRAQRFGPVTAQGAAPQVLAALSAAPNPFTQSTVFTVSAPGRATLRIFDARGRLVRSILENAEIAAPLAVAWEGDDLHGRAAPAGVYFARLECAGGARARRIVKLP